MEDKVIAFVYGTLKVGGFFAWRLDDYRLDSQEATIKASLHDGPYPMLIDGDDVVHGEVHVYKNGEETLALLDEIECYSPLSEYNLYERRVVNAVTKSGEVFSAYAYFISHEELKERCKNGEYKKIESGVWEV